MSINERGVFHYIIKYIMNDRKKKKPDTTISLETMFPNFLYL